MQVNSPGFWNDQNQAKKISKQLSQVNEEIEHIRTLERLKDELETYLLLLEEDFSEGLLNEAVAELKDQKAFIEKAEIECYLNEKFDHENAILIIHAGAGGTEAQDWAEMLLRMYTRWAEQNRFSCIVIDSLAGEEAGLKSVSVEIGGNFAYGMLKAEIGIHRLVRISPFNAQGKRQTSFASVFVYPEFDDDIEVEIDPKDLKIDTYRSSGAGGQHVNTTDSAVRITHLPTGIVVTCQDEKSQIKNKAKALKVLRSRLLDAKLSQQEQETARSRKVQVGTGDRSEKIRTYNFPQSRVTDHRINLTSYNLDSFLAGNIEEFIQALRIAWRNEKVNA